ncbi:hypothetical protein [Methylobacterium planeticum]|uniref:Uncharacterized protein n=1 Tax=Methylobacterium planeticum TaxID=2615211 RepID=A0A6N6MFN1_9HYPH|nr:hypothetical protein [Methylobacterium planeticum]KAB1068603.1 hypothetical protein F6X51_26600 [Methylobacterium planeticum]
MGLPMRALEKRSEVRSAAAVLRSAFAEGAKKIGALAGEDVLWHEQFGIWGIFGKTRGRGGVQRDWNAFGQKPFDFRSNIVVEINQPNDGIDQNLQGIFARDDAGSRWLLHQGRMSVPARRITEADFIAATRLEPEAIEFSDGSAGRYHKVTLLDGPAALLQEGIAAFVARCAQARLAKTSDGGPIADLKKLHDWEHGLSPEATGTFDVAARAAAIGHRRHGEVWRALTHELRRLDISHSNDRVGQYGPDLFTSTPE